MSPSCTSSAPGSTQSCAGPPPSLAGGHRLPDPGDSCQSRAPIPCSFLQRNRLTAPDGTETKTYYPKESTGIATGFLIAALHQAGLATLTHTPSPMEFLNKLLGRPSTEKPFLLLVVGYPAEGCEVSGIEKLALEAVCSER